MLAVAASRFLTCRKTLKTLECATRDRVDLVHFNSDNSFLVAKWLRSRTRVPFVMHMRTTRPVNIFYRWQARVISNCMDHLVFITENEKNTFTKQGGEAPNTIINNIIEPPTENIVPDARVPRDKRLRVASLANYTWRRGTDQLVDVAEALARRGRRDVLFVMAGEIAIPRGVAGELGKMARHGGTLADYAERRGVGDMFMFLGHVDFPDAILSACHVLAKPTRTNDPWGRSLMEAYSFGIPAMAVGVWDGIVRNGETGVLTPEFDAEIWADALIRFADDRALIHQMGQLGKGRIMNLCKGDDRAADLLRVWKEVILQGRRERSPRMKRTDRASCG